MMSRLRCTQGKRDDISDGSNNDKFEGPRKTSPGSLDVKWEAKKLIKILDTWNDTLKNIFQEDKSDWCVQDE